LIKILYIVLGIYILIKFYSPIVNDIKNIKKQIFLVDKNIEKNKFFFKKSNKIKILYNKTLTIDKENKKYLFTPSQTSSEIFIQLQLIIKNSLNKYSIKIKYIRWLDVQNDSFFKKYPIKISIITTPEKFANFINSLCKSKKLLNIEYIKINSINPNKEITYEVILSGYQLKGNK